VIDLGRSTTSDVVTLTNVGGRSFDWTRGTASPFGVSGPTGGRLKPGQSVELTISIDRPALSEGSYSKSLAIGGDFPTAVQLKARVERRPVVDITSINDANAKTCISSLVTVSATVADESPITSVQGTWTGPAGTGTFTLTFNGQWTGSIAMSGGWGQGNGGTYALTVTATDSRGNVGSDTGKFFVETCPG
jgi:hypothetical protein